MNYKDKIEEKIMQYSKELLTIRDTHNVPWLINECTKASNVLAEELTALYEQAQRDAVGGFVRELKKNVYPLPLKFQDEPKNFYINSSQIDMLAKQYLNQTKEDIKEKQYDDVGN